MRMATRHVGPSSCGVQPWTCIWTRLASGRVCRCQQHFSSVSAPAPCPHVRQSRGVLALPYHGTTLCTRVATVERPAATSGNSSPQVWCPQAQDQSWVCRAGAESHSSAQHPRPEEIACSEKLSACMKTTVGARPRQPPVRQPPSRTACAQSPCLADSGQVQALHRSAS